MPKIYRRHFLIAAAAVAVPGARAMAQAWPARAITFVVPTAPGGAVDALARAMAEEMGKRLGQPVIVDNKTGASGMLAAQAVAHANPDGYIVLVTSSTPIVNAPFMFAKLPYNVQRDLSFVTQVCAGQLLFTVNSDVVQAKSMKEFIAWAEKNKGKVSYGSYGIGTVGHLLGAFMSQSRALDMVHLAYKGEAPMMQDLLGGQLAWGITSAGSSAPHLKSGKLRALAVIGDQRAEILPQVPTMAEAGLPEPEYKLAGWVGMLAPSGTPAPVLARLESEARAAALSTPMKARFQVYAMQPVAGTSSDFRREVEASLPVYERLIRAAGVKPG